MVRNGVRIQGKLENEETLSPLKFNVTAMGI
jgi:hypothetical protein